MALPPTETGLLDFEGTQMAFTICRSRRRKRTITLSLSHGQGLRVMAPMRTSLSTIHSILNRRATWIARRLERLTHSATTSFETDRDGITAIPFLGVHYRALVTADPARPPGCALADSAFYINVHGKNLPVEGMQSEIRFEIIRWFKRNAGTHIKERMDHWSERLGVAYRQLIISSPRRQWGSCSVKNVIRINWRILMAPPELVDYLVAHELAHVRHKNHGPAFWRFLHSVMPDHKKRRAELRQLETGILTRWR